MGAGSSQTWTATQLPLEAVHLHIYDASAAESVRTLNKVLRKVGTGIYHCGVEIYGREWSFGAEGVFCTPPRCCYGYPHFESIPMGQTSVTESEVLHLMMLSKKEEWTGADYNLLERNCCHFCDEFCRWLGVGGIPTWTTSLAGRGAAFSRRIDWACYGGDEAAPCLTLNLSSCGSSSCSRSSAKGQKGSVEMVPQLAFDAAPGAGADEEEEDAASLQELAQRLMMPIGRPATTPSPSAAKAAAGGEGSPTRRGPDRTKGVKVLGSAGDQDLIEGAVVPGGKRSWTL